MKSRSLFRPAISSADHPRSRKLHQVICKSNPTVPIAGIHRLLRVSPGFAAQLIRFDARHSAGPPRRHSTNPKRHLLELGRQGGKSHSQIDPNL
jgi:hypothetical protein